MLFLYVEFPTAALVALFVGLLGGRLAWAGAVVALVPITVIWSGETLHRALESLLLLVCAALLASYLQRLVQRRTIHETSV